ncbi:MAG: peptidoglycan DD-metalloendopeptidase family protein [Gammaproteobacteria bacterium]
MAAQHWKRITMTPSATTTQRINLTHGHWMLLGILLIVSGVIISIYTEEAAANRPDLTDAAAVSGAPLTAASATLTVPAADSQTRGRTVADKNGGDTSGPSGGWRSVKVKRGDNLSVIFSRLGISPQALHNILALGDDTRTLKHIRPGQMIKMELSGNSRLLGLKYEIDPVRSLRVWRNGDDHFKSSLIERPVEHRIAHTSAVITSSLFEAAQQAGLSDKLTMELAGIFGWDIDFALDIRDGDRFSVIYDDLYLDGKRLRHGDILAAEFVNNGASYRAVRYTDARGHTDYYSPDGKSMRKAFLRTPVAFTRISSYFTKGRYHPILHRIRAHKGVDYAAPIGTPVKATGDGKVIFVGRRGGYGNAIVLRHGVRYSTLYGHLSRFARGLHRGKHVRQGQTIGYVGMTGLATGPHLHYEFRIHGVHHNPLTVHFPDAAPLPGRYKQDFMITSRRFLAQLDAIDGTSSVALNDQ